MHNFNIKNDCVFFCIFSLIFILFTQVAGAAELKNNHFATELKAKSAILMDENGVILFEKDSHKALPPASVTKVMTLLLVIEAVESGKANLTDSVVTSEKAWKQGGSQIWLEAGEVMNFREMLIALAVVSANDAAVALMEHIYGSEEAAVAAMNNRAKELGLNNTHFANVNGLPIADHYLSTYDTALIVKEAVKHALYLEVCSIKEYWLRNGKNWLVNTNKLLWWYSGADGLKTGWTEAAQYCFAGTAKRDGLRLISVVFAAPEPRSHLKESMKLLDWGFANFKAMPIVTKDEIVTQLKVGKGTAESINLLADSDLQVLVEKGEDCEIEKQLIAAYNVIAPIKQGDKCGELLILKNGKEYGKVALIAAQDVESAGFFDIFQFILRNLFSITK